LSVSSRSFKISLGLVLSLIGSLFVTNPASAVPQVNLTYSATSSTADGFNVPLYAPLQSPYSVCTSSVGSSTAGSAASDGLTMLFVTGLSEGQMASVTVNYVCQQPETTNIQVVFSGSALRAALTPAFGAGSQTDGSLQVPLLNYDSSFTWSASSDSGSAQIVNEVVYVTGLSPDTEATVTVSTVQSGYAPGSSSISVRTLQAASDPTFSPVTSVADGFTVDITNRDGSFSYSVTSSLGAATLNISTGRISVSGLLPGQSATVTVRTFRERTADGYGDVTGSAISGVGRQSTFSSPLNFPGVAGAFSFQVTNLDSAYSYSITSSSGSGWIAGNTVSVAGATAGAVTVTVVTSRSGYQSVTQTVTHLVPAVPPTPQFPSAFATNATTAFVTWGSVEGATGYTVTTSPSGPGCSATLNFCTISGLTAGSSYTFSIVATNSGLSSAAATTGSVVMGDQLAVGGSVSSATWKVGSSVSAVPLIIGQYSVLNYQWYRCSSAVGTQVAPPSCEAIGGATSSSYTLSAADLGKFVTAHLSATGGVGVVTKTLSNGQAVLATDATGTPSVDPEGKPVISNIPDRQVSVVGGTEIVINGTGFSGVTSVTVNGVAAKVIKSTDTSIIVSIPASTTQGLVDLVVTTAKGAATAASALAYVATPIALPQPVVSIKVTKSAVLKPYVAKVVVLSAVQKKEIETFVSANSKLTSIKCVATTNGVKKSSAELKLAVARAKAACAYAKTLNGKLQSSVSGVQGKTTGKVSKVVKLTLTN